MNIQEKIKKAKLRFFKKDLIYWGMCAYKFDWRIRPFSESIEGYVMWDQENNNFLSSGGINLNENHIKKSNYTHIHLVFIICHELLHILHKHGMRRRDRDPHLWNVACDHVIEVFLKKIDGIEPFEGRYNIVPQLENKDWTAEKVYDWLKKNIQIIKINYIPDPNDPDKGHIEVRDEDGNLLYIVNPAMGGVEKDPNNDIKNKIDQYISGARALFENMKGKGDMPGYMTDYLEDLLKVEIPWEELLEKAIKTNVILKPDDRSWSRLNKYFMPSGITLPGYFYSEDTDGVGTLIIGADSSGSISRKDLKIFAGIIVQSITKFKRIVLIVHDVPIHQIKEFDQDSIRDFHKFIKAEGFKGRGGTSHTDFFNKVQEMWEENPDEISMVISLTDMGSNVESIYKNQNWIKNNVPLVFIISNGHEAQLDPNFGEITQIMVN